ncbi:MAG: hypothetical protein J1E06_00205 [Acutalibacter sp.]|nr:hypothetical protein [Acutalibacter sp.]
MRYARGQDILPANLLTQLQQYIDGAYLYIPRKKENRLNWGERTHSKEETAARNRAIFLDAEAGADISALAETYFLAEKTVRRILSEERKKQNG